MINFNCTHWNELTTFVLVQELWGIFIKKKKKELWGIYEHYLHWKQCIADSLTQININQ